MGLSNMLVRMASYAVPVFQSVDVEIKDLEISDLAEISSGFLGLGSSSKWVLGAVVIVVIVTFVVLIRMATKIAYGLLIALAAVTLITQFSNLRTCLQTCECNVYGQSVSFPQMMNYCAEEEVQNDEDEDENTENTENTENQDDAQSA